MFNLKLFEDQKFGKIRVAIVDGEPWFALTDIARAIGYNLAHTRDLQNLCRESDIIEYDLRECSRITREYSETKTGRGNPNAKFCNEKGLYRILCRCQLPKTEPFEAWVFDEVLPSIRKTGGYGNSPSYMEEDPVKRARLWADEQERLRKALTDAEAQRDEAIRTKAQIGSKREATAMATAATARAEVRKLEAENTELREKIGDSENFKAVTAIPWLSEYFDMADKKKTEVLYQQLGRGLKSLSHAYGYEVRTIESSRYAHGVGAYSKEAIDKLKTRLDCDPEFLSKYRKSI